MSYSGIEGRGRWVEDCTKIALRHLGTEKVPPLKLCLMRGGRMRYGIRDCVQEVLRIVKGNGKGDGLECDEAVIKLYEDELNFVWALVCNPSGGRLDDISCLE